MIALTAALLLSSCAAVSSSETEEKGMHSESTEIILSVLDMNVYVYARSEVLNGSKKVPLILYMCGTSCDPEKQPVESGYAELAGNEDLIVISPDYRNASTYSETDRLASLVQNISSRYPVDVSRIYAVGFSNGGAAAVALTSEHPELFAGIAAYGWMVDMRSIENGFEMPFQVIQGSDEFTETDAAGRHRIMPDEQKAVRSLLLYDHMIQSDTEPDYETTPYWGYVPDSSSEEVNDGIVWTIYNYRKDGFQNPFAQLILVEGARHIPHFEEAEYSWNFLHHYSRSGDGTILED